MQAKPRPARRAYLALGALSLMFFLITAGTFTALGVVLPDMVAALKWRWSEAGLGYTLLALACGLASLAPAMIVRKAGVRAALALGGGLLALGYFLISRSFSVAPYLAGASLLGVGFALTAIIPGTFVLARSFSHRSTAIGAYYMAGSLGGVAGPALYHLARAAGLDWRGYWFAFGLAVLTSAFLAVLAVEPGLGADGSSDRKEDTEPGFEVHAALKTPQFWTVTAAYTAYLLCETSLNGLSAAHMTGRGLSPEMAGALISLQALVNTGARLVGGWLGERVSPHRIAVGSLVLVSLGIGGLGLASTPLALALAVTAVGIGYGASSLATTLLLINWFGRRRNLELMSAMCLVSTLAAAGPFIGGMVKDASGGFAPAFMLFAGVSFAALTALAFTPPPRGAAPISGEEVVAAS